MMDLSSSAPVAGDGRLISAWVVPVNSRPFAKNNKFTCKKGRFILIISKHYYDYMLICAHLYMASHDLLTQQTLTYYSIYPSRQDFLRRSRTCTLYSNLLVVHVAVQYMHDLTFKYMSQSSPTTECYWGDISIRSYGWTWYFSNS